MGKGLLVGSDDNIEKKPWLKVILPQLCRPQGRARGHGPPRLRQIVRPAACGLWQSAKLRQPASELSGGTCLRRSTAFCIFLCVGIGKFISSVFPIVSDGRSMMQWTACLAIRII